MKTQYLFDQLIEEMKHFNCLYRLFDKKVQNKVKLLAEIEMNLEDAYQAKDGTYQQLTQKQNKIISSLNKQENYLVGLFLNRMVKNDVAYGIMRSIEHYYIMK